MKAPQQELHLHTDIHYLAPAPVTAYDVSPVAYFLTDAFWVSFAVLTLLIYGGWALLVLGREPSEPPRWRRYLSLIIGLALFLAVTQWFHHVKPYDKLFYGAERRKLLEYNGHRLLFAFYFVLILYGLGKPLLAWVERERRLELNSAERFCIRTLIGSALLRLIMFVMGLANLYSYWTVLPIAIVGTILGWGDMMQLMRQLRIRARAAWTELPNGIERCALSGLWAAFVIAMTLIIVRKLITPDGVTDYYSHYIHYYREVLSSGGIWPNDVWYHFYVSKGVGDVFFSLLLSDRLGPAIVSGAMFVLILTLMYVFVKRMTGDLLISVMVITLIAGGFIYTWDTMLFGPWGDFAKQHITTAALYLGCVWACWMQMHMTTHRRGWMYLTAIAYMGLVLMRPQFAFTMSISLGTIMLLAFAKRRFDTIVPYITIGVSGVAVSVAIHILNYAITGLAEVTPFRPFWKFADQEKLSHWISPFLGLELELGSSPEMGGLHVPDFHLYPWYKLLYIVFKLNYIGDFIVLHGVPLALVAFAGVILLCRRRLPNLPAAFWEGVGVLLSITVATAAGFLLLNQIISMFRFTVFSAFVSLTLPTLLFFIVRRQAQPWRWLYVSVGVAGTLIAALAVKAPIKEIDPTQLQQQLAYMGGMSTIADTYHDQGILLRDQGFLWEPGRAMCDHRPAGAAIWYVTVMSDQVVTPNCHFETFFSYAMGKDSHRILFESPEVARGILQQMGLNYFAFNNAVGTFDLLPYSPLFRPETVDKYFTIVWTDGTNYLLTWKQEGDQKATLETFAKQYGHSVEMGQKFADFKEMYRQLDEIYAEFKKNGSHWPVRENPNEPHPRGWQ